MHKGCFNHYLYVSAADAAILNALFDLGFGKERLDALLDLRSDKIPSVVEPKSVPIRQAGKGDNMLTGSFSDVIFRALGQAPYWHSTVPEDWDELYEGWSELADDKGWTVWLALDGPKALGMIGFHPEAEEPTQMLVALRTMYLSVAATKPQARGRGISTDLTWHMRARLVMKFAIPIGSAPTCWPRFGFKDVAYWVAKKVSPMIAWAK